MAKKINQIINLIIKEILKLGAKETYNNLKIADPEGWCIYKASQEILKINVYEEFYAEDNMGMFEESDGHELKKYVEIVAFGECTYKIINNSYEVLDAYFIDYYSTEYKDYLNKLYSLTNYKLIEKLKNETLEIKLMFLKQNTDYFNDEALVEIDKLEQLENIKNNEENEFEEEDYYEDESEM